MSSSEQQQQQSDQTTATTASNNMTNSNGNLIGFCHQCDRQVEIDPDFFTCKRCDSGFIELFEGNAAADDDDEADEAAETDINNSPHARMFRFDTNAAAAPNFENLANQFLPLLFPQLINQATMRGSHQPQPPATTSGNEAGTASATPQHQPTRNAAQIQFFLPAGGENTMNEQIDLYGIINNVVSDLLNQRSPGNNNNNPFVIHQPFRMVHLHGDMRDYAWGPGGLDTIITQLLNQLENTGPPPATDDDMRKLPTVIITEQDVENKVQCAICMEEFVAKSEAKKLPCKHLFHESCINQWLQRHGTCPVCRKHLNGEDTTQNEYVSPAANVEAGTAAAASTNQNASSQPQPGAAASTDNSSSTRTSDNTGSGSGNSNLYTDMDFD